MTDLFVTPRPVRAPPRAVVVALGLALALPPVVHTRLRGTEAREGG